MGLAEKVARTYREHGFSGLRAAIENRIRARKSPATPFPLRRGFRRSIDRALDHCTAAPHVDVALPSIEDLDSYWSALKAQVAELNRLNPGDPYFDPEALQAARDAGRRTCKNLFDIWLAGHAAPRTMLEVGTRTGLSLLNKLAFLPDGAPRVVFCFDLYCEQGSPSIVRRNLRSAKLSDDGVFFIVGDSRETLPAFAKEFAGLQLDYVLVDGSHVPEDAAIDLKNAIPLVRPGGYLVFDDAGPSEPGSDGHDLIEVWNAALAPYSGDFESRHYDEAFG
ncbi:MAG: class I SAM-dependent methyltransferase, partial [Planctomycetota bacterium]